jgi:hypothetical protein
MEHLTCFAGGTQGTVPILEPLCLRHCFARVGFAAALTGMFALGSVMFTHDSNQLHVGKELTKTCYQMCAHSTTRVTLLCIAVRSYPLKSEPHSRARMKLRTGNSW